MSAVQSYMTRDTDHTIQDPDIISYKMYACDFCNYKSERIWCINQHTKTHHGYQEPSMFKCRHCDYQSNLQYNWHERSAMQSVAVQAVDWQRR